MSQEGKSFFPIVTAHWRLQAGEALQLHRFKQQKIIKLVQIWFTCRSYTNWDLNWIPGPALRPFEMWTIAELESIIVTNFIVSKSQSFAPQFGQNCQIQPKINMLLLKFKVFWDNIVLNSRAFWLHHSWFFYCGIDHLLLLVVRKIFSRVQRGCRAPRNHRS